MAFTLPNGTTISIASTYGSSTVTTSVSNATEAVAALTSATGFSAGCIVEVTSGWSKLDRRIARVKTLVSLNATLESVDTSSTTKFPSGSGVGSARPISAWTQISQITEITSDGGTQGFATYSTIDDTTERQIPTNKSAMSLKLKVGDDVSLPHYALLVAADDDKLPRAIRAVLPNGSIIFYNCFVSINKTPSLTKDQVMVLDVTLSLVSDVTRYAS